MKRGIITTISLIILMAVSAFGALTPEQVLRKASSSLLNAKGIECRFSLSGSQGSLQGSLKAKGKKFAITTPGLSTWYDGKTMWTANASTKETTVTVPTAAEVAEVNPLAYIHGYDANYRIVFSKNREAGKYRILLNPKKRNTGIKAVDITINAKSFKPERIYIRQSNGQLITVMIRSLNLSASVSASEFTYPASRYRGYETVDLR